MIKFLGIIDILASIAIAMPLLGISMPQNAVMAVAVCLLIKGLVFIRSAVSSIDILSGIALLLIPYLVFPRFILIALSLIILQKGIFSMLSH
ncbi:MAG: hypothetical protein V1886_01005 [archaeon]